MAERRFLVRYHHRHGVDAITIRSETKPEEDVVDAWLNDQHGYEAGREDEYWEIDEISRSEIPYEKMVQMTKARTEED